MDCSGLSFWMQQANKSFVLCSSLFLQNQNGPARRNARSQWQTARSCQHIVTSPVTFNVNGQVSIIPNCNHPTYHFVSANLTSAAIIGHTYINLKTILSIVKDPSRTPSTP